MKYILGSLLLFSSLVPASAVAQSVVNIDGTAFNPPVASNDNDRSLVQNPRAAIPSVKRTATVQNVVANRISARGVGKGAAASLAASIVTSYALSQYDLDYWVAVAATGVAGAAVGCLQGGITTAATGVGVVFTPLGCGVGALLGAGLAVGASLLTDGNIVMGIDGFIQGDRQTTIELSTIPNRTLGIHVTRSSGSREFLGAINNADNSAAGRLAAFPLFNVFPVQNALTPSYYRGIKIPVTLNADDTFTVLGNNYTFISHTNSNTTSGISGVNYGGVQYDFASLRVINANVPTLIYEAVGQSPVGLYVVGVNYEIRYTTQEEIPSQIITEVPRIRPHEVPFVPGALPASALDSSINPQSVADLANQVWQANSAEAAALDPNAAYNPNDRITAQDVREVYRDNGALTLGEVIAPQAGTAFNPDTGRVEPLVDPLASSNANNASNTNNNTNDREDVDLDGLGGVLGEVTEPILGGLASEKIASLLDFNFSLPSGNCPTFVYSGNILGRSYSFNSSAFCDFSESQRSRIELLMKALISFSLFIGFLRGVK